LIAFNLLVYRALRGSARGIRHEAERAEPVAAEPST
jgi:hypothetical protein